MWVIILAMTIVILLLAPEILAVLFIIVLSIIAAILILFGMSVYVLVETTKTIFTKTPNEKDRNTDQ